MTAKCPYCNGAGTFYVQRHDGMDHTEPCMMCDGTGILEDVNEEDCDYSLSPPVYDPGKNFE